jgi:hypothetical protein
MILIVRLLFWFGLHDLRTRLSGVDPLWMTRRRLGLLDKGRPHRKSQRILILLQAPHTFANDRAFQHTGHGNQSFDVGQVQTHSERTQDHGIILGEAEFFSRDLADQRKPLGSYVSQQRPENFHRGTYLHSHPQRVRLSLFRKADESNMTSPFDGGRQFALVPHAIAGDTPRDNPTPLRQKVSQQPDILEIDRPFVDTESTRPSALEKPPATAAVSVSALLTLHKRSPSLLAGC